MMAGILLQKYRIMTLMMMGMSILMGCELQPTELINQRKARLTKVSLKAAGVDILKQANRHNWEADGQRSGTLDLSMTLEEGHETTPISCPDMRRLSSSECAIADDVIIETYGLKGSTSIKEANLCSTYANADRSCLMTLTDQGAKGIWRGLAEKRTMDFTVSFDCSGNDCHKISATQYPKDADCATEDLDLDTLGLTPANSLVNSSSFELQSRKETLNSTERHPLDLWLKREHSDSDKAACYPGIEEVNDIHMGIVVGGQLAKNKTNKEIKDYVESLVSAANTIFVAQMNVRLKVKHLIISDGSNDWDYSCSSNSSQNSIHSAYSAFKSSESFSKLGSVQAVWHMIDQCVDRKGVTGAAFVGTLCQGGPTSNSSVATAITWSRQQPDWLTFTHEMGHIMGSQHSFEKGKGKTGGIMDYGSGQIDGVYQFNRKYREGDFCDHLSNRLPSSQCQGLVKMGAQSQCGNGTIDPGEQCECGDGSTDCACCQKCRIKAPAQCSPFDNPCCTEQCTFRSGTDVTCDSGLGAGYCHQGICTNPCPFGGTFCGTVSGDSCQMKCQWSKNGQTSACGALPNQWGLSLPEGSFCSNNDGEELACNAKGLCVDDRPKPIIPDPITPDPITPDPITPDPITPDPITPDPVDPPPAVKENCLAFDSPPTVISVVPTVSQTLKVGIEVNALESCDFSAIKLGLKADGEMVAEEIVNMGKKPKSKNIALNFAFTKLPQKAYLVASLSHESIESEVKVEAEPLKKALPTEGVCKTAKDLELNTMIQEGRTIHLEEGQSKFKKSMTTLSISHQGHCDAYGYLWAEVESLGIKGDFKISKKLFSDRGLIKFSAGSQNEIKWLIAGLKAGSELRSGDKGQVKFYYSLYSEMDKAPLLLEKTTIEVD